MGSTNMGDEGIFKAEFKKKNIGFNFNNVECFYRCQWPWPRLVLVLYRVLITNYIWAWLVYSVVAMPVFPPPHTGKYGHVWPAFLTNWSYAVLAVYLTVATVVCMRRSLQEGSLLERPLPLPDTTDPESNKSSRSSSNLQELEERPLPLDIKIEWCLFTIISNFVFIVTMIYFGILYPRLHKQGYSVKALDIHIHGINSVVVLIEMFVAAYPVRLLHIIYPILYGLAYVLFSLFYYASDTTNRIVYQKVLDWRYPGPTIGVILGLALIVIPLIQLMLFGIYRLRHWLFTKYVRSTLA